MEIIHTLDVVVRATDALCSIATFNWTKKNVIILGVAASAFVGATAIVAKINSKNNKKEIENDMKEEAQENEGN